MKIVSVEIEERRGGIFLFGEEELRRALWLFFEKEKIDFPRYEVQSVMSKIPNQSFKAIDNYISGNPSTLRIEVVDRKVGLYVMRIKQFDYFDVENEVSLAKQIGKPLSIINFLVKVEVERQKKGGFAFDFREISKPLKSVFPDFRITAGELSSGVMRSYDAYSGRAVPFDFYRMDEIQLSLSLGQEMSERRVVGGCPISEGEPVDTWKLNKYEPIIRGPFVPTTKEPLPCLQIIVGKIKSYRDASPMVLNEDIALTKSLAEKIAAAMKM